ncbi:MAG: Clp protease N-terminal domain-containing protein, partial [Bacteroidales bacterium]|nr:Clp protease N-terminal domain-containing protein [Bacteroidales bacterium]
MNLNQFTIKAQQAIQQAQHIAAQHKQQAIENIHLLKALIEADEHLIPVLLQKLNVNVKVFQQAIDSSITSLPRVEGGGEPYFTNEASKTLQKAQQLIKDFGDDYVSIDHLLLAVFDTKSTASTLLKDNNIQRKDLQEAIMQLRQGKKVDSPNAEQNYDALNRYARNLNQMAAEGKLDPVIGRDDEIRRV